MNRNGFTLIEVVIVLAVVAILAAIMTPTIVKHIEDSRIARAGAEVNVIGTAITTFYKDVGTWPTNGDGDTDADDIYVLYSGAGTGIGGTDWETFANSVNGDTFGNQLIRNAMKGNGAFFYNRARWNGPYFSEDKADPWGHRYYCNVMVGFLGTGALDYTSMMVISAGPDGNIQTPIGSAANSRAIVNLDANDIGTLLYGRQNW